MTKIVNFPAIQDTEETPQYRRAYMQGYRDAIDDAMRATGMVRLGRIETNKELTLKQEIVAQIRSLRGYAE